MNDWNQLETQLRSWTPRAPSADLRARIFGEPLSDDGAETRRSWPSPAAWHWLAPAMAVFLFGMFVFGKHPGALNQFSPSPSASMLATAALSQPDLAPYYASTRHSDNNMPLSNFEWTNGGYSLTTRPPMAPTNTSLP